MSSRNKSRLSIDGIVALRCDSAMLNSMLGKEVDVDNVVVVVVVVVVAVVVVVVVVVVVNARARPRLPLSSSALMRRRNVCGEFDALPVGVDVDERGVIA